MKNGAEDKVLTRVKKRGAWQVSRDNSDNEGTVNNLTMFVIGATAFSAGFWALACLANALLQDGPLRMLSQLATAVTGP